MKTSTTALVALVALASSAIACSSPAAKEDVDTASALSALRTPTGSFSEQTAGKAFGSYRSGRASSSHVSTPGASVGSASTGTRSASIRLLDHASAACGGGQSCACPNGGSLTYAAESNADGQAIKVDFDACGFEDGWAFDGKAVLLASKKSLLGTTALPTSDATGSDSSSSTGSTGSGSGSTSGTGAGSAASAFGNDYVSILLAAKGTASKGENRLSLEFALVTEAHYAFLAVQVADGKVVVGISDDGHAIVKSREGTWTCHTVPNGWTCTSDSGKSMTVAEEASSEGASATSGDTSSDAPSGPLQP